MHIEISAGGLRGGVAVASFQNGMKSYISGTNGMISSFKAVASKTYNLNGGVGRLSEAVGQVNSRVTTEESRKSGAEVVQRKANDFLDLAMRVDKSVAAMVKQDREELYGKYPGLRPSVSQWARDWLSDAWNGLCGLAKGVAKGVALVAESIRKLRTSIGEYISKFMQEHKIIGSILLYLFAVASVSSFAAILAALSVPAAIASVLVAIFAVVAGISCGFNIAGLLGALDGEPILQKIQSTLNGITSTVLLIGLFAPEGGVAAIIYGVSSAIIGITGVIDTWVTIDNDFYTFMKDVAEIAAFVSGIALFREKVRKFVKRLSVGKYNTAGSKNVRDVESVKRETVHRMPTKGDPNSVVQNYSEDGNLITERYFDANGNPYLDIDYTDHANPGAHPEVPHEHQINTANGQFERSDWKEIGK